MTAPAWAAWSMSRRCPRWNGVSRTISTRRRPSFNVTSAARLTRSAEYDEATADSVLIEHGATIIPAVRNDPLLMGAEMSREPWT